MAPSLSDEDKFALIAKCYSPIHGSGRPLCRTATTETRARESYISTAREMGSAMTGELDHRLSTERFSALHDLRGGMGVQRWEDVPTHFVNVNY